MSTGIKIGIVGVIIALLSGIIFAAVFVGYFNSEARLRNQFNAQQKNLEVVYDETWKVISQTAQVSDQYATQFKEIYVNIMDARYSKGDGTLMKWIHEANPNFDSSLYEKLATAIEAKRATFAREQKKALDIKRQHDDLRTTFPSNLVCGGKPELELKLVTSTRTSKAFETGVDDEVDLFKKN